MSSRIFILFLIIAVVDSINYSRIVRQFLSTTSVAKNKTDNVHLKLGSMKNMIETRQHPYVLFKSRGDFIKVAEQYIINHKPYNYKIYKPYTPSKNTFHYNKDYVNKILNSLNLLQSISSTTETVFTSSTENSNWASVPSSTTEGVKPENITTTTESSLYTTTEKFEITTDSEGVKPENSTWASAQSSTTEGVKPENITITTEPSAYTTTEKFEITTDSDGVKPENNNIETTESSWQETSDKYETTTVSAAVKPENIETTESSLQETTEKFETTTANIKDVLDSTTYVIIDNADKTTEISAFISTTESLISETTDSQETPTTQIYSTSDTTTENIDNVGSTELLAETSTQNGVIDITTNSPYLETTTFNIVETTESSTQNVLDTTTTTLSMIESTMSQIENNQGSTTESFLESSTIPNTEVQSTEVSVITTSESTTDQIESSTTTIFENRPESTTDLIETSTTTIFENQPDSTTENNIITTSTESRESTIELNEISSTIMPTEFITERPTMEYPTTTDITIPKESTTFVETTTQGNYNSDSTEYSTVSKTMRYTTEEANDKFSTTETPVDTSISPDSTTPAFLIETTTAFDTTTHEVPIITTNPANIFETTTFLPEVTTENLNVDNITTEEVIDSSNQVTEINLISTTEQIEPNSTESLLESTTLQTIESTTTSQEELISTTDSQTIETTTLIGNTFEISNISEVSTEYARETLGDFRLANIEVTTKKPIQHNVTEILNSESNHDFMNKHLENHADQSQNERPNRKAKTFSYATDVMPSIGDFY